ncbi:hypothetical protein BH10PAT1_BH10PAT1_6640 [soil metagenome]
MRKEVFFAIVAGGAFGLLIAFAAWKLNSSAKPKLDTETLQTSASPTPIANTSTGDFKIILSKPNSMAVFTDTPSEISGVTDPKSWVVVSGIDGDTIVKASDSGSFSANIDLEGGANQINVTAFNSNWNEADANLLLIFSSQFQKDETSSTEPISYLGTITDITDSIIQIKNSDGDIQQISAGKDAVFIDTRSNASKVIKSTDVAIGDYLIAMGYKGNNNILNSSRIIISDAITKPTRKIIYGTVTDDSGYNKFEMKNDKTKETVTITPATGIAVNGDEVSFGNIKNNEKVIVIGEEKDGNISARTIQVMK